MIQRFVIYALVICIPIATYIGYDYGEAKERDRSSKASQELTKYSIAKAAELRKVKEASAKKTLETINVVRNAKDETNCLDTVAPKPIRDELRDLQSVSR